MRKLLIIGAGGHGRSVADAAIASELWSEIEFGDDGMDENTRVLDLRVIGVSKRLWALRDEYNDVVVAIGDSRIRLKWMTRLREHGVASIPTVAHPRAYVSPFAEIGAGSVVLAGAVVGPATRVGEGCILNTGCSVDHDCTLGDGVHISPGARAGGTVRIGDYSWVCIGASVANNVAIGANSILAAGAALVNDMPDGALFAGIPAVFKKKL